MANSLPQVSECCTPCDETTSVLVPGPAGAAGAAGDDGDDGVNAFTTLAAQFTMPASGSNVTVQVQNSSWMAPGQKIFVQNAGYFEHVSSSSSTNAVLKNLGYTVNVAAATVVASGNKVSPGGVKGDDGVDGTDPDAVMTTKGDIITRDASAPARKPIGTDGQIFMADSAQATGNKWGAFDLAAGGNARTNDLPIADGGTGQSTAVAAFNALSPVTTRGDIIKRGVTNNERLAIGAANRILASDGTDPSWRQLVQADILPGGPMSRYGLLGSLIGADFNTTSDQAINILSGVTRYIIRKVIVENASVSLTTPVGGIYTNAAKAGTAIVAAGQVYTALTASSKWLDVPLTAIVGTDVLTAVTVYLSLSTPHGSAATANLWIFGENLTP